LFIAASTAAFADQSANFIKVVVKPAVVSTTQGQQAQEPQALAAAPGETPILLPAAARRSSGTSRHHSYGYAKPITKCKLPAACGPVQGCAPACGPPCILPTRKWGQWEPSVQVFYARTKGILRYPALVFGALPASEIDLNGDLGLDSHKWLLEYSLRYQFRPHWAVFYSIIPLESEQSHLLEKTILVGQIQFPAFTVVHTKWDRIYQRVGLLFQPIDTCNARVSVYANWLFDDQKIRMSSAICPVSPCVTVDRTRNMAQAGLELQKCIRTMCNGGTLSCDSRAGISFLDGAWGIDVQAGLQFSVPMNCGRWGYVKGGYRLIQTWEDRNDLRLDTTLEGWFGEGGLIF